MKKNCRSANASRDYTFEVEERRISTAYRIWGKSRHTESWQKKLPKITALLKLNRKEWTSRHHLPGGDFKLEDKEKIIGGLLEKYKFLNTRWAERLFKTFGSQVENVLGRAKAKADLGRKFGYDLTEREVLWYINQEHVRCVEIYSRKIIRLTKKRQGTEGGIKLN